MSLRTGASGVRSLQRTGKGKQKQSQQIIGILDGSSSNHGGAILKCSICTSTSSSSSHSPSSVSPSSSPSSTAIYRPIRIIPKQTGIHLPQPPSKLKQTKRERQLNPVSALGPSARDIQISKIYALQAVPPVTALSALGNRISSELLGVRSGKDIKYLQELLEKCCTCKSFWEVVQETEEQQALSGRSDPEAASITTKKYTNFLDADREDNESLAVLGNHLLGVFAVEWLESRYPHLPERVMKAALTLYVGPRTCADIASKSWGITSGQASRAAFLSSSSSSSTASLDQSDIFGSHRPGQPLRGVGEGNRAGLGLLRWGKSQQSALEAITRQQNSSTSNSITAEGEGERNRTPLPLEEALASSARAIVGAIFQEHGFAAVRQFVHSQFLSRSADLTSLLKFPNPKYTLTNTLSKYSSSSPVTRLIAETGRLSISPIFVMGVYSSITGKEGEEKLKERKLGEGYGSSLAMAEYRACEDALRRIYLSPLENPILNGTSEENAAAANEGVKDMANRELPSDTLVYPGRKLRNIRKLADEEVLWQSAGRSGVVASPQSGR